MILSRYVVIGYVGRENKKASTKILHASISNAKTNSSEQGKNIHCFLQWNQRLLGKDRPMAVSSPNM